MVLYKKSFSKINKSTKCIGRKTIKIKNTVLKKQLDINSDNIVSLEKENVKEKDLEDKTVKSDTNIAKKGEKKASKRGSFKNKRESLKENKQVTLIFYFNSRKEEVDISRKEYVKFKKIESLLIKELDNYFKESNQKLNKLTNEYNTVISELDSLYLTDEIEKNIEIIEGILFKLEYLKREFELLEESLNLKNIYKLENDYLIKLFSEYSSIINSNKIMKEQLINIKKTSISIEMVKKIKELEQKSKKVYDIYFFKKSELEARNKKFLLIKEKIQCVDDVLNTIKEITEKQSKLVLELEDKLKNSVSVTEKIETTYKYSNRALNNLIVAMALLNTLPNGMIKSLFIARETFRFVRTMFSLDITENVIKEIEVIDYTEDIKCALDDTKKVQEDLDSLDIEILEIMSYFDKDFSQYILAIPEYTRIMEQLKTISEIFEEQKELVAINNNNLERELGVSYEKVKTRTV